MNREVVDSYQGRKLDKNINTLSESFDLIPYLWVWTTVFKRLLSTIPSVENTFNGTDVAKQMVLNYFMTNSIISVSRSPYFTAGLVSS